MITLYCRLVLCAGLLWASISSACAQTATFERHFGTRNTFDELRSMQPTTDGGYVAIGTTFNRSHGNSDLWLVKTTATGDTLWTRSYGTPAAETGVSVHQTPDGGYLLAGSIRNLNTGQGDFYLVKTTATGAQQWQRTFGSSDLEVCNSMVLTADGGALLAGYSQIRIGNIELRNRTFLVKTNAAGAEVWSQLYTNSAGNGEQAHAVQQTTDGGYIVAGEIGAESDDLLLKVNALGATEWRQSYATTTGTGGAAYAVQQTADGGYVLGGKYTDYSASTSVIDGWVVKTTALGVATRTFHVPNSDLMAVRGVQQTANGGYAMLIDSDIRHTVLNKVDANWQLEFSQTVPVGASVQVFHTMSQAANGDLLLAGVSTQLSRGQDGVLVRYSSTGALQLQREYGTEGGTGYELGRDVAPTPDGGGVVVSEEAKSSMSDTTVLRLTKLSPTGSTQWSSIVTVPAAEQPSTASIRRTPDGGYILLVHLGLLQQAQLIKTDSQGVVQWRKTYGGISLPAIFGKAIPTTDGGYAVITGSPTTGSTSAARAWLLKLNATGDTLWTHKFSGFGLTHAYDLVQTTDGGYAFAGRTMAGGSQQAWAVRTTSTGQPVWSRTYGRASSDRATSIQQTADGGFILAGFSRTANNSLMEGMLLKLSATGDSTWSRLLPPIGTGRENFGYRALQTSDGGYLMIDTPFADIYLHTRSSRFTKLDASGTIVWQRSFGTNSAPTMYSLEASADGGFIGVGGIITADGDYDVHVVKIDGSGNVLANRPVANAGPALELYPNPAFEQVRVQLPKEVRSGPVHLVLHDHLGRVVRQWHLLAPPADVPLDTRGLARGGYLLRVNGSSAVNQLKLSRRVLLE